MYSVSCADMGHTECSFVAQGSTKEEAMANLMVHGKEHHPEDLEKGMSMEEIQAMVMSKMKMM